MVQYTAVRINLVRWATIVPANIFTCSSLVRSTFMFVWSQSNVRSEQALRRGYVALKMYECV